MLTANDLQDYRGAIIGHGTSSFELERILQTGHKSQNFIPDEEISKIRKSGVGEQKQLPAIVFACNDLGQCDLYTLNDGNYFPVMIIYPTCAFRGYKVGIDWVEFHVFNADFDPELYTRFHQLLKKSQNKSITSTEADEFTRVKQLYKSCGVNISPSEGIVFVPSGVPVYEESGILPDKRLPYIPGYVDEITHPERYSDIPDIEECVEKARLLVPKLLNMKERLLTQEGIITTDEYMSRFLEKHNVSQSVYFYNEGSNSRAFAEFAKSKKISLLPFQGKPTLDDINCDGFCFLPGHVFLIE